MSRLNELIEELCPDGVEYKVVDSICDISKGVQFNKTDMMDEGTYPVINGGINPSGYIEQYNQNEETITISQGGASAGYVNWQERKFWAGAHCYILKPKENVLNRYLFHFVKSQEKKLQQCQYGAGIPALGKSTISELCIPIPPLPVQHEIVRILDSFTELTAKLKKELKVRKTQYNYYRDLFLSFDKTKNVDWLPFEAITEFIRNGYNYKADGDRTKRYKISRIETISTGYINMEKVGSSDVISDSYLLEDGDILFSHINSLPYLGNIAYYSEEYGELYHGMNLLCFRSKKTIINPKYLYYYMKSSMMRRNVERYAKQSCNQYSLSTSDIKKWRVPVPSLEEQKAIVKKIEQFDTISNNMEYGLPAEINLREKQYMFYRDKLLSFNRKMENRNDTTGTN